MQSQNYTIHTNYIENTLELGSTKTALSKGQLFYYPIQIYSPSLPTSLFPSSLSISFVLHFLPLKSLLSAEKESKCPKPLSKSPCVCLSPFLSAFVCVCMCLCVRVCVCTCVSQREEVKKRVTNICEKMSRVFQFSVVPQDILQPPREPEGEKD